MVKGEMPSASWIRSPVRRELVFWCFAILTGTVAAGLLLGPALDPRNLDWLLADSAQNYMGWAFLRKEPRWTFPPTWTYQLGYPLGVSIGFLDSIPLFAIPLRPFSALLSEPFQYLGLFGCASLVLQAYFGAKLAWRASRDSMLAALLGGLLFVIAPPFIFRFGPHLSLTSQGLILASLWRYATPIEDRSAWSWFWPFLVVQGIAGAIHPYVAAMCLLGTFAGCVRLVLERRCHVLGAAALAGLAAAVTFGSMWVVGFVPVATWQFYIAEPFGSYSMNLVAPLDPAEWGSVALPSHRLASPAQIDGYNYLGLGGIVLLAGSAGAVVWNRAGPRWPFVVPLVAIASLSLVLALGPRVTLGPEVLFEIRLPDWLMSLLSPFRATGRFFWLAYYILFMLGIAGLYRAMPSRRAAAVLLACLVIQIADTRSLMGWVRSTKTVRYEDPLKSETWNGLGKTHRHLTVLPPWQCGPTRTPGGPNSYWPFGRLALRENMTSNTYYANRIGDTERRVHCSEAVARVKAEGLVEDHAYVLDDQFMRLVATEPLRHHACRPVDGYNVCMAGERTGVDEVLRSRLFVPFPLGIAVAGDAATLKYGAGGWEAESGAAWSVGRQAGLVLPLPHPVRSDLELTIDAHALTVPRHPRREVAVSVHSSRIATLVFEHGKPAGPFTLRIPHDLAGSDPVVAITFTTEGAQSPLTLGLSMDSRMLGVYLRSIRLQAAE